MKKRMLAMALAATMMFSLTACGEEETTETEEVEVETEETTEEETTEETAEEETEETTEAEVEVETEETTEAEEEVDDTVETFDFTSTTVIDTDEVSISIDDFDFDSSIVYDCEIGATFTNKSSSVNYDFTVESVTINGLEASQLTSETVTPGNKGVVDIGITLDDSEDDPITQYTDVAITFSVSEEYDYFNDLVYQTVHVYPYGTDNATTYTRESQDSDVVFYEDDNISVILVDYGYDSASLFESYDLEFYFVNKTADEAMFSIDDVSVNSTMVSTLFANSVSAGASGFYTLSLYEDDLEDIGITDPATGIETIDIPLHAYDSDDYVTDYVEDTFTLTFNQ